MALVFVYGTLKEGFPNSAYNRGSRLVGEFITCEPYLLYLVGERCVPWLIHLPGEGVPVCGQLYHADTAALAAMDALERIGEADGYRRERIRVRDRSGGESLVVFAYLKPAHQLEGEEIREGPLASYEPRDAARYIPRTAR
ncbi:MAG: hypothetical protein Kow006_21330 [Gammaproteobacteria bacterium]